MNRDELPRGWGQAQVGKITERVEKVDPRAAPDEAFTYVDIGSIDNSKQRIVSPASLMGREAPSRARQRLRRGDTVFSTVRTYLRNIGYVDESLDGAIGSTGFSVLRPAAGINPRYLYYFTLTPEFVDGLTAVMRGTSYPAVVDSQVRERLMPIAPSGEQTQIVAAIEEEFSRLDAGEAALARVQRNLGRMRASLLRAAVTGELVPGDPSTWVRVPLPSLGNLDRGKSRHRPRNDSSLYGGGYPFIQTGDVTRADPWIEGFTQTYNERGLAQSRLWPRGTVCITIAANIARTGLLAFDGCFPDSVVGFVAHDGESAARWVELVIRSMRERLDELAPATAQKNINLRVLRALEIPYPGAEYRAEVVAAYDRLTSVIAALESDVGANLVRADALRSATLTAAFAGRLVPQDGDEELASALLERIATEQNGSASGAASEKTSH